MVAFPGRSRSYTMLGSMIKIRAAFHSMLLCPLFEANLQITNHHH